MLTPRVSFEFFPPKSLDASFRLWETVQTLAPLDPSFVSVTYGAGGTTRKLTHEAVETIHKHYEVPVDATREETLEIANSYAAAGVTDIVALRGDPPKGADRFKPAPGGFTSSVELIEALADAGKFTIRVGAYPDRHPEAASAQADVDFLKRKVDAGAKAAITQFFFEAETFFRFRDLCAKAGIDAPILPGILPVEDWKKTRNFAARCGANVPDWMDGMYETAIRDGREDLLSIALATELCSDLIEGGVEDLHFYTLNKPELTREVCAALGVTPKPTLAEVAA
jgi:methylenetetrahydrofolate reductase (NADPH)